MFLLVFAGLTGWFVIQLGSVLLGRRLGQKPLLADSRGGRAAGRQQPGNSADDAALQPHRHAVAWLSGSISGRWKIVAQNSAIVNSAIVNSAIVNSAIVNSAIVNSVGGGQPGGSAA